MLAMEVEFTLYSLKVDLYSKETRCFHIDGNVSFDNVKNTGQVIIQLSTLTFQIKCDFSTHDIEHCEKQDMTDASAVKGLALTTAVVDGMMFGIGLVIFFLLTCLNCCCCCCCCYCCYNKNIFTFRECLLTIQWWNVMCIVADSLILSGIVWIIKMLEGQLKKEDVLLRNWDHHVIYLGLGCLLTWFSFARFFRMHYKFTFKKETTFAETLFSLINGDEIFATFSILQDEPKYAADPKAIYVVSRLIIYIYVSLFTILVFNLLIALFNNAYEVIVDKRKERNKEQNNDTENVSSGRRHTLRYVLNNSSPENVHWKRLFRIFFPSFPFKQK